MGWINTMFFSGLADESFFDFNQIFIFVLTKVSTFIEMKDEGLFLHLDERKLSSFISTYPCW